jgi:hypothetical protein
MSQIMESDVRETSTPCANEIKTGAMSPWLKFEQNLIREKRTWPRSTGCQLSCGHHEFIRVLRFFPIHYRRITAMC